MTHKDTHTFLRGIKVVVFLVTVVLVLLSCLSSPVFPTVINRHVEFIFHTHKVLDPLTTRGYSLPHVCVCLSVCGGVGGSQEGIVFLPASRLRLVESIGSIESH